MDSQQDIWVYRTVDELMFLRCGSPFLVIKALELGRRDPCFCGTISFLLEVLQFGHVEVNGVFAASNGAHCRPLKIVEPTTWMCIHIYIHIHIRLYIFTMCISICICIYIYIYMYAFLFACLFVYASIRVHLFVMHIALHSSVPHSRMALYMDPLGWFSQAAANSQLHLASRFADLFSCVFDPTPI